MCGIIYVKKKDGAFAAKSTLKRFERQKTRGTDGFGYVGLKNGVWHEWWRAETEDAIKKQIRTSTSDEILFHHRFPTSTPNVNEATHPIVVSHPSLKYDYYVVHNGIIRNAEALRTAYEKEGFKYGTVVKTETKTKIVANGNEYKETTYIREQFNDSESFAIDIAKVIESDSKKTESLGSIAFIAMQVSKTTKKARRLYFGRNFQNPLVISSKNETFSITSVGDGTEVKADRLWYYDYAKDETVDERYLDISPVTSSYDNSWNKDRGATGAKSFGFTKDKDEALDDFYQGHYPRQKFLPPVGTSSVDIAEDDADFLIEEDGSISLYSEKGIYKHLKDRAEFMNYYAELAEKASVAEDNITTYSAERDYTGVAKNRIELRKYNEKIDLCEAILLELNVKKDAEPIL